MLGTFLCVESQLSSCFVCSLFLWLLAHSNDHLLQVQLQVFSQVSQLVLLCALQLIMLLDLNQIFQQLEISFALFPLLFIVRFLFLPSFSFAFMNEIGNVIDPLEWSWESSLVFQELSLKI